MSEKTMKLAILVDGDNAQPKLLEAILGEVSKYGKVTVRRIYGDWTDVKMNGWKDILNNLSFNPIQKFTYTTGKNSTDSAMIIDAMDILHEKLVDGFCIVSSDSDFTGLAKRIREDGVFVMGIGEKKTPNAFQRSCEIFTYCENIAPAEEIVQTDAKVATKSSTKKTQPKVLTVPKEVHELINKAFDMIVGDGTEIHIAKMGIMLRSLDPSFDARTYGFKNLTGLFSNLSEFEVKDNMVGDLNHPLLKRKK